MMATTMRSLRSLASKRGTLTLPGRCLSTRPQPVEQWPDDMLSFRSYAMKSPQFKFSKKEKKKPLDALMRDLPATLRMRQQMVEQEALLKGEEDPVMELFSNLKLTQEDWAPYAHFDPTKAYTRNLIYTDNEQYTLLLLCWNVGVESKIHDHPCDGCWLQVLQGQVQECRYEYPTKEDGDLKCNADLTFEEGQTAFIDDTIGLHKIGNPGTIPAVTLHLYAPPFAKCKVWDEGGGAVMSFHATHFSEYGWVDGSSLP